MGGNAAGGYVYVDIETTGLNEYAGDISVISIDGRVYHVLYPKERKRALSELRERLKREVLVCHNAQFDVSWLREHFGLWPEAGVFDTMVAYQVLNAGREGSSSLGAISQELLGEELDKSHQASGWDGMFITDEQREYAARDTLVLPKLKQLLESKLKSSRLWHIFELEMLLLPILVEMHRKGIALDVDGAHALLRKLEVEAEGVEASLPEGLNPRSPEKVKEYFNLPNAQEDTIRHHLQENPEDGVAKGVLEYKKITKKMSFIRKQLLEKLERDGRLHPRFTQTSTATGRFSCKDPNLQQVDRGSDVRGLFVPASSGRRFVVADYAQLELRLAAYLSRDEVMLKAYRDGRDLHSETCERIFGQEDKRTRTLSKNINFASVFGGGHGTLIKFAFKNGVVISEEEAMQFHDSFHEAYPGLSRWQKEQGDINKGIYVYTPLGRRRYIPKGQGYCTRINTPVQGCGADGMKIAIYWLHKKGVTPTLTVHDELLVECGAEEAPEIKELVEKSMVYGMCRAMGQDPEDPVIPIEVEGKVVQSWAEK